MDGCKRPRWPWSFPSASSFVLNPLLKQPSSTQANLLLEYQVLSPAPFLWELCIYSHCSSNSPHALFSFLPGLTLHWQNVTPSSSPLPNLLTCQYPVSKPTLQSLPFCPRDKGLLCYFQILHLFPDSTPASLLEDFCILSSSFSHLHP